MTQTDRLTVAAVEVVLTKTVGHKDTSTSTVETRNMQEDVLGLRTNSEVPEARVSMEARVKVSDSVLYGEGTWDKIPYSVEVTATVSLACDQDPGFIAEAQQIAKNMAIDAVAEASQEALATHIMNIKDNLYPGMFR